MASSPFVVATDMTGVGNRIGYVRSGRGKLAEPLHPVRVHSHTNHMECYASICGG